VHCSDKAVKYLPLAVSLLGDLCSGKFLLGCLVCYPYFANDSATLRDDPLQTAQRSTPGNEVGEVELRILTQVLEDIRRLLHSSNFGSMESKPGSSI
jgi:hypothetical protein